MGQYLKKKWLLVKISQKRAEMISLGERLGLGAIETIECSQQLDELLNQYEDCTKRVNPVNIQEVPYEFGQVIRNLLKKTAS
ncbi:aspartyl-phosphate phosphatase Spo0E family protein [Rossellomorea aquimaris]|uniref:aspartyl-phosphate phosphatase Spo0E family protein n=1 Tax=Rossellomorea aquimaris TaxID=189382 RepID=UPI001CD73B65|nr:aspartyl-phosphate phosphatase Spo0E family protein [Rossellomorea aquimaris]MCA1056649.1 aspartyl-phosphate phosphatase Spo0E family protein [Rossellomorea aquimaris]